MEVKIKTIFDKKLKKDFQITIPFSVIENKINETILSVQKNLNLKGFRKGSVPVDVIKQKYGQSIMAEESDKLVSSEIRNIIKNQNLKIALQPKVEIKTFEANKDLECVASFEIFPDVPEIDMKKIKVIKKEIELTPKDIEDGVGKLVKMFRKWAAKEESYKAKIGDSVKIDYVGKIDKIEFEGGSSKDHQLELGSKSFIDDFEEQLVGKKSGDEVKVKVKFPKEYHNAKYAGQKAEFEVKINQVLVAEMPEINDDFIKNNFGLENKEKLDEAIKQQISQSYDNLSRDFFKKELFDFLNKKYDFDLPSGLVDQQLNSIWKEVEEELKSNPDKFKNDKEKEKAKEEKRGMAQRMIRCGIILNDISQKNKIEVNNDDINKELSKIMQKFAGQEKAVIEYYQKNSDAIQQLKGNIIEEKTIDFILQNAEIETKKMSLKDFDKAWQKANEE